MSLLDDQSFLLILSLTTIPVVIFALWADSVEKEILNLQKRQEDLSENKNNTHDLYGREAEPQSSSPILSVEEIEIAGKVRVAGFMGLMTQLLLFLMNSTARSEHPLTGMLFFMFAIGIQSQIQIGLEKKILKKLNSPVTAPQVSFGAKAMLWTFASLGAYFLSITLFLVGSFWIAKGLGFSEEGTATAIFFGGCLGFLFSIGMTFAVAPIYIRQIFSCEKITDSKTLELIHHCFNKTNLSLPNLYLLKKDYFPSGNAMVTGFQSGKGPFKPALFISETLLELLNEKELEAVLFHEMSHLHRSHLKKRFLMTITTLIASVLLTAFLVTLAYYTLPTTTLGVLRVFSFILPIAIPYIAVKKQINRHETEADELAIFKFGASFEAYSSALRKIDETNLPEWIQKNEAFQIGGHPETEKRIQHLKSLLEEKNNKDDFKKAA
tara:strand:+ start:1743 stop:3056 length:1314 start_codon:yes stop_codon:yes gene_type:complete